MINIFDRTLKIIARNYADTFLRLAFPGQSVRLLGVVENVEISLSVKPVDFVHRVSYNDEEYIFHLEFQLTHQPELPRRTFIMSAELTDQFNLPVLTLMLYLKPRQKPIPSEYISSLGSTAINRFTYPVLKLWDYVDQIRNGHLRELAPLLPMLVTEPNEALLVEERALILQETDDQKRRELLAAAIAIGSRYFNKMFLWQFFREEVEELKKVSFIEDWIQEGIEEGIQKGIEEGRKYGLEEGRKYGLEEGRKYGLEEGQLIQMRETIGQVLITRFDPLARDMKLVEQQLAELTDLRALRILFEEALTSETFAEFADKIATQTNHAEA